MRRAPGAGAHRVFAVLGRVPTPTGGPNPMTKVPPLGPEKR